MWWTESTINREQLRIILNCDRAMGNVYLFLAEGFEEVEALSVVDILRRAGLSVKTVSVTGNECVSGAHGVGVKADMLFDAALIGADAEMLVLPGGLPGATNLAAHEGLRSLILDFGAASRPLAAICAAPMVYGRLGLLKGRCATCYPGFEQYMEGAQPTGAMVEQDANFITGKGPGAAFDFALAIVAKLAGEAKAGEVKAGMLLA